MKMCAGKFLWLFVLFVVIPFLHFPTSTLAEVTLNSSLTVTETYTDNLFFESQKNKRDDFGTFIIPSVSLAYLSKDIEIEGTYTGVAQFYVNHPGANAYTHNGNFGIDLPFLTKRYKGLEVELIESFNFQPALDGYSFARGEGQQDAASQLDAANSGANFGGGFAGGGGLGGNNIGNQGVFTNRNQGGNSFQNVAGIRVQYQVSPRWTPRANYQNSYVTFTDRELNDSLTHQVGAGVGYRLTRKTTLSGDYSASFSSISGGDNFVTHTVTVGGSHAFSPTLNVNTNVGVSWTESLERLNFNTSSSIAKLFDRGSFTLSYNHGVTPGGGLATSATLTQNLVATANYTISKSVGSFVSGGVAKNESLSGNSVDVTSYQGQAGISVVLLSWLDGTLTYSYIKQKSKGTAVGGRTATVNQGFLGLTATIPEWRIIQ